MFRYILDMSKGKKRKKTNKRVDLSPDALVWLYSDEDDESGTREPPSAEIAKELKQFFDREFKKTAMWRGMIEDFGGEEAEKMLKEIYIEGKDEQKD